MACNGHGTCTMGTNVHRLVALVHTLSTHMDQAGHIIYGTLYTSKLFVLFLLVLPGRGVHLEQGRESAVAVSLSVQQLSLPHIP